VTAARLLDQGTAADRSPVGNRGRGGAPARAKPTVATLVLLAGAVYCLFPVVWVITAASKSPAELFSTAPFVPGSGLFGNLKALFAYRGGLYVHWALNSLLYAAGGAAMSTAISAAAGFAFAKYRFPGRSTLFAILLLGVLLPQIILAMPQYLLASHIGLSNTYWSVFLPGIVSPFGIYLARIYAAATIPDEMLEAARVDGAGEARIFRSIALPVLVPGLVTIFLLQFISVWNNFLLPYVMLSTEDHYPLTLGLFSIMAKSKEQTLYSIAIAGAAVAVIPLLALMLTVQRFWRLDLLSGGVKR
jgi:multiple sugar transport system permease protein